MEKKVPSKVITTNPGENKIITAGDRYCYCYVSVSLTENSRLGRITDISAIDCDGHVFFGSIVYDDTKKEDESKIVNNLEFVIGGPEEVRSNFIDFIDKYYKPNNKFVQFVMDKVLWNWPIFMEFLCPKISELPSYISPLVVDLNSELANAVIINKELNDKASGGEGEYKNFVPVMIANKEIDRVSTADMLVPLPENFKNISNDNVMKQAHCIKVIHQSLYGF